MEKKRRKENEKNKAKEVVFWILRIIVWIIKLPTTVILAIFNFLISENSSAIFAGVVFTGLALALVINGYTNYDGDLKKSVIEVLFMLIPTAIVTALMYTGYIFISFIIVIIGFVPFIILTFIHGLLEDFYEEVCLCIPVKGIDYDREPDIVDTSRSNGRYINSEYNDNTKNQRRTVGLIADKTINKFALR